MQKGFSSFKNNYIFDLQDRVNRIQKDEPKSDIFIYHQEFKRIGRNAADNNPHIKRLPFDDYSDPATLYIEKGAFSNSMYLIVPNYFNSSIANDSSLHYEGGVKRYSEIERFYSNAGHRKYISFYRHIPYTPAPNTNIDDKLTNNHAVLKAFIPEYDAFIYQIQDRLIWLIGAPLDPKTEIIYHIHTDQPELLPASRIKYRFDNRGFRINDKSERERIGTYRVFEKTIPSSYHITLIKVGFYSEGKVIGRSFCVSQ